MVYPKKVKKKESLKVWEQRKLNATADMLIADVINRIASSMSWKDGFVPDPTTYLRNDRWEDEIQQPIKGKPSTKAPGEFIDDNYQYGAGRDAEKEEQMRF